MEPLEKKILEIVVNAETDDEKVIDKMNLKMISNGYLQSYGGNCFNKRVYPTKDPREVVKQIRQSLAMCCSEEYKEAIVRIKED